MEKTTKKKKSKSLKRRIGLIAIGGLSLVLTVCLSVGATLAWFAGSTNASNTMYMGGPVYVEMAGRGAARGTEGTGTGEAKWVGGSGNLDIVASTRSTGTVVASGNAPANVLLPGQRLMIYSQARVFSTSETSTVDDGWVNSQSSGANNTNMQNGTAKYKANNGRITTTTTSVLRARFSINVEFDPSVGINNFTTEDFATNYPVKSQTNYGDEANTDNDLAWYTAWKGTPLTTSVTGSGSEATFSYSGRRDAVSVSEYTQFNYNSTPALAAMTGNPNSDLTASTVAPTASTKVGDSDLLDIKEGAKTSIYKWKYVSKDEYTKANAKWKMGKPFDGTVNSSGKLSNSGSSGGNIVGVGNGYYGLWVSSNGNYGDSTTDGGGTFVESDAFYKARTQSYLKSYRENYVDEYERNLVMGYETSLTKLEDSLNESFTSLVNWSSDAILTGTYSRGFSVTDAGVITGDAGTTGGAFDKAAKAATWLYVDPATPGAQDTNASDSATSKAGWWYLVKSTNTTDLVSTGANHVATISDFVYKSGAQDTDTAWVDADGVANKAHKTVAGTAFQRAGDFEGANGAITPKTAGEGVLADTDDDALLAELFEISPDTALATEVIGVNKGNGTTTSDTNIIKTVSISFPFVNGSFALPGKELTNNFANAKITFQITFQALQAFFPYTRSIDGFTANDSLLGIGKALNIQNAIPIYNEAFDWLAYL